MEQIIFSPLSIYIFTTLSSANNGNNIPHIVREILKNKIVANLLTFISVFIVTKDIKIAIIYTAVLFVLNNIEKENFTDFEIQPGCHDATVEDLLSLYDNDPVKLRKAIYLLGVPLSVDISEENAPYIASFIIGNGTVVKENCPSDEPAYSCLN
jgi:hypothetical protein